MKKILLAFGTRPEAIKMAPVFLELQNRNEFETKVCVTGQHREMLDQVLGLFNIKPEFDLNVMKAGQSLAEVTASILTGFSAVLDDFEPDVVLVHGDTATTLSCTLAAYYKQIAVGHVEAGLRTHNIYSPWPEEGNRRLAGGLARFHFAPTENNRENLLAENVQEAGIHVTGNTVIDALMHIDRTSDYSDLLSRFPYLDKSNNIDKKIVLVTGHRRENFGQGFLNVCSALKTLSERETDLEIVYPVHLNPNVRKPVLDILSDIENVNLIEPLGYRDFIGFMKLCDIILTDSGGVQEEAPSFGKPVLVMRDTTERQEAVNAGTVKLVGTDSGDIVQAVQELLHDPAKYSLMASATNPYGDGRAAERIADALVVDNN